MSTSPEDTVRELLDQLRTLREDLFQQRVHDGVRALDAEQRREFVELRMQLIEAILRLETAQLSEIRQALESHADELSRGILSLTETLSDLEAAASWAQGLGQLLSVVSRIVPIL